MINLRDAKVRHRIDILALFAVQPLIAGLSILGLRAHSATAREVAQPVFIWGGVLLIGVIFAEGIWSFAWRHASRQSQGLLWAKLMGAALCAILAFASAYKHLGLVDNGRLTHGVATALYFSITTWTSVGYGDVVATLPARPFAAAQSLVGIVFNSALIGLILHATINKRSDD